MTAESLAYDGHPAAPLPGLPGWFTVPVLALHFFARPSAGGDLRCEVRLRQDGTARAELWHDGDRVWERDYGKGEPGFNPYRDVLEAAADAAGSSSASPGSKDGPHART